MGSSGIFVLGDCLAVFWGTAWGCSSVLRYSTGRGWSPKSECGKWWEGKALDSWSWRQWEAVHDLEVMRIRLFGRAAPLARRYLPEVASEECGAGRPDPRVGDTLR